jgi:hypothetical protein
MAAVLTHRDHSRGHEIQRVPADNNNQRTLHLAATKDGGGLFDVSHDALFKLTPVAAEMWELLAEGRSTSETASEIARRYQVDEALVVSDLSELLRVASQMGLTPALTAPSHPAQDRAIIHDSSESIQIAPAKPPWLMVISAFVGLTWFDMLLCVTSMEKMCRTVKTWRVRKRLKEPNETINNVCNAVQQACIWFPHKAVCLQRAAITTCMLRSYGIDARMVIGIRPMPFLAHAWTEVNGAVVNERPQVKTFYQTLTMY